MRWRDGPWLSPLGQWVVLAGLLGVVGGIEMPARHAFVVELVGREDLLNAIALNSSVFHAARIVGPAIAGLLLGGIGPGPCFVVNGLSYAATLAALAAMRLDQRAAVKHGAGETGLTFVVRWRTPPGFRTRKSSAITVMSPSPATCSPGSSRRPMSPKTPSRPSCARSPRTAGRATSAPCWTAWRRSRRRGTGSRA